MPGVILRNVVKSFGETDVIHGVDIDVQEGEFCVLVGPSGCGKSTILRMIAGLENATDGVILIGSEDVTKTDPADRGVAMVFQTYALYPHMTVAENIGFGLRMNGIPKSVIQQKVSETSRVLKLEPLLDRKPKSLSGGQRQRVAIGRAIIRDPKVFLFDEPLSNLDAELRVKMRVELSRLHKEIGATMIYVTHDQVEAMTMADRIVVLRDGRVEQIGTPMDLYSNPHNRFVASFIGSPSMNFFTAEVSAIGLNIPAISQNIKPDIVLQNMLFEVGIRPEHLKLVPSKVGAQVDLIEKLGGLTYVYLEALNGEKIVVSTHEICNLRLGDFAKVSCNPSQVLVFEKHTGKRMYASPTALS